MPHLGSRSMTRRSRPKGSCRQIANGCAPFKVLNVGDPCLSCPVGVSSSFMAGETIVVVDDAPVNLRLAAAVLRGEGYKVHLASSAEEALMMLRSMVPHLLLVDIQLPGMNGLELTRRLRQAIGYP